MQTRQAGLEGTGEIRLRELVKQALRMRRRGPVKQHAADEAAKHCARAQREPTPWPRGCTSPHDRHGRLADWSELAYDEAYLGDGHALTAAIHDLLAQAAPRDTVTRRRRRQESQRPGDPST